MAGTNCRRTHIDTDGDPEVQGALHLRSDQSFHAFQLGGAHLEEQFVVDLQYHSSPALTSLELAMDVDHGELDEIGRRPLDRRICRDALAKTADIGVLRVQFGDVTSAAEERLYVALFAGAFDLAVEVGTNGGKPLEVVIDEGPSLADTDA